MKRSFLFLIPLSFIGVIVNAQPPQYLSRGVPSYLVNYGAINGDPFLARFAARRFRLIDEGSRADIKLMQKVNPSLPILVYKDIVALHKGFPEYPSLNRIETSFMHTADPASLVVLERNDTVWCSWMPDRRGDSTVTYELAWYSDSLTQEATARVQKSSGRPFLMLEKKGAFLEVFSKLDSGSSVTYSRRTRPRPLYPDVPYTNSILIEKAVSTDEPARAMIEIAAETLTSFIPMSSAIPDSIVAVCDVNRDNLLDTVRERSTLVRLTSVLWYTAITSVLPARSLGGYEFLLFAYKDGKRYRFPEEGMYTTNVNNRMMNDYYGFYIMDVGSAAWKDSYISEVLGAFHRDGYTGLFEDDTWYRIERWGVDAFPPHDYDEHTWRRHLFQFLDSIQAAIEPYPAYFNGLYADVSDSLLLHTDGGMTEGFAYTHWSDYVTGNSWKLGCDLGLKAQHGYKRTWLALGGAPRNNPEARLYVLGSYLLVADSLGLYANATDYQEFSHFPEFDLPLGAPLTTATTTVDELKQTQVSPPLDFYVREFEHGTVVVNPNASGNIAYNSDNRFAISVDTLTSVDGGRISAMKAGDTIPPKHARIYLGRATASASPRLHSPEILSAHASPEPAPADGSTPVLIEVVVRDSSDTIFLSDATKPFFILADCGAVGGPSELLLRNDGSPASSSPSTYSAEFTIPVGAPPKTTHIPVTVHATTGLLAITRVPLTIRSADSLNLVLNYSFEIDNDDDGTPDLWRSYVKGFDYDTSGANSKTGRRSVHVRNDSLTESRGVYATIILDQTIPKDLELSGWSKAVNVSGTKDGDYSLYIDVRYQDGTPLYGQTAPFSPGTHAWEYASRIIRPTKPIKSLSLYVLFRRHTGEAWFDHLSLHDAPVSAIDGRNTTASSFSLGQAFPNPAGKTTEIPFTLMQASHVRLELFDLLGRYSNVLVDGDFAEGQHSLPFESSSLPDGVYYYCIITRFGLATKSLIIGLR